MTVVGRVLGTDDATPLEFWVALNSDSHLQLDDVVAIDRVLPNGEKIALYGIVGNVRARHEGARFDSDVFLIADGILPAEVSEAALVQVTRVVPETFVPPRPGTEVRRAVDQERDAALDFDDVERRLPAGLSRDEDPIYLDLDFIDGTKGAHINISGISGVATKTSYATFLLYSLFNSGVLGLAAMHTKGLIFNVKGEDLLFLDHANTRLKDDQRVRYGALGLQAAPFKSVGILAPPRPGQASATPATGARLSGLRPYFWTIADFCGQRLLPFLFADAEDERQQYTIVVQSVTAQLEQIAHKSDTSAGAVQINGKNIRTFKQLVEALESILIPDDPDEPPDPRWSGDRYGHHQRLCAAPQRLGSPCGTSHSCRP